jgi:hypothetical protein
MIEYHFRVPSAIVFTLYSYSKVLEYRFIEPNAGSLITLGCVRHAVRSTVPVAQRPLEMGTAQN